VGVGLRAGVTGAPGAARVAAGEGAGALPSAPDSSSLALFGLHTTNVTTPSVFFKILVACKINQVGAIYFIIFSHFKVGLYYKNMY